MENIRRVLWHATRAELIHKTHNGYASGLLTREITFKLHVIFRLTIFPIHMDFFCTFWSNEHMNAVTVLWQAKCSLNIFQTL